MAATSVAAAIPDVRTAGYGLVHGSSELVTGGSTPKTIPAALRLVEEITRPPTAIEAVALGVHAFGTPNDAETEEDDTAAGRQHEVMRAQNSVGDLTDGHLGSMDIDQLRSMHDKTVEALRARGEHSAGDIKSVEDTIGGMKDLRRFDKAMEEMEKHDKTTAQITKSAKGEGTHDGEPVMSSRAPGVPSCVSEPLAQKDAEDIATQARQQHEKIKQYPAAQASTPPLVTLRSKTRAPTPTARDTIMQLAEEVDKHKLNLYHVNELNAK